MFIRGKTMTEELGKEATAYALEWGDKTDGTYACCRDGYLAGAEPREKEIKSLGERCLQLQKDKGNLTDKVRDLEAQIEKMKSCYNCSKWNDGQCADIPDSGYCCADFVCEDWEIKEN